MKRLTMALVFSVLTGVSLADAPKKCPKDMSAEEFFAMLDAEQEKNCPSGDLVLRKTAGKVIAIRNRQTTYTAEEIEEAADSFRKAVYFPAMVLRDDEKDYEVGAEVVLQDKLDNPRFTVLTAPEQAYATLATAWLVADNPPAARRSRRLRLELLRAIGMSLGLGISMIQPCVMEQVRSLDDLDHLRVRVPGPEGSNNIEVSARKLGIEKVRFATYRKACEEGWAPAPRNDVEKRIWNEVRKVPDKPLKIEFDRKAGK